MRWDTKWHAILGILLKCCQSSLMVRYSCSYFISLLKGKHAMDRIPITYICKTHTLTHMYIEISINVLKSNKTPNTLRDTKDRFGIHWVYWVAVVVVVQIYYQYYIMSRGMPVKYICNFTSTQTHTFALLLYLSLSLSP